MNPGQWQVATPAAAADHMGKLLQALAELAAIGADPGCQEQEPAVILHLLAIQQASC